MQGDLQGRDPESVRGKRNILIVLRSEVVVFFILLLLPAGGTSPRGLGHPGRSENNICEGRMCYSVTPCAALVIAP